jgi:DNA-binding response OmpR family regulator
MKEILPLPSSSAWEDSVHTRVLVIDDDVEMTELLKIVLEPNEFEVFSANSGVEGIESIRKNKWDVIILDLLMPEMDGWQVCEAIREFSQVPILVLSAVSKPGMVSRALDAGADDYLIKPMPSSVLVAHIKNLTRRARAEKEAAKSKLNICL